jgi:hypothetical protein
MAHLGLPRLWISVTITVTLIYKRKIYMKNTDAADTAKVVSESSHQVIRQGQFRAYFLSLARIMIIFVLYT